VPLYIVLYDLGNVVQKYINNFNNLSENEENRRRWAN